MKKRKGLRIIAGVLLCVAGFVLARATPYRESTVIIGTGDCRLVTDVFDSGNDDISGSVVLLHGLSANKKLMAYMARAFAAQNLRVFVPDFPGHGRTPGPFSFARAEACSEVLVRQLIGRRGIDPARTVLAGHSMGGAIAERLAARIPVAGVIAISPAPMSIRHGIAGHLLPFENAPPAPPHTLVVSGSWEPASIRETARDLISDGSAAETNKYVVIPRATHVSLLLDPHAARASQEWVAQLLGLPANAPQPSLLPLAGSFIGFAGILLLAGPFIRETLGANPAGAGVSPQPPAAPEGAPALAKRVARSGPSAPRMLRALAESALASLIAIAALQSLRPLSLVRLFDGDSFAAFLLIAGVLMLVLQYKSLRRLWNTKITTLLAAALTALLLFFLVTAWFDATLSESWLTWPRWARFPIMLIAALPYLAAEELFLANLSRPFLTMMFALGTRLIAWLAILFGIFVLHHGPILLLLLAPYFALLSILQLAGANIVRTETRSPAAAAVFGAILLAGFCLVIFPVT